MIKRANNKKKKGFTLIELIIVLAVMAIIALIAIPNFAAVRNNSKVKADLQSCETIKRTVLMLVSDDTIKGNGTIIITPETGTEPTIPETVTPGVNAKAVEDTIKEALAEVKKPQGKDCTGTEDSYIGESKDPTTYSIVIETDGSVEVVTGAVKE